MTTTIAPAAARRRRTTATPYLFLALPLAFLAVIVFYPLLREVWISFTDARISDPNGGDFIGLDNYRAVFASPELASTIGVTISYTAAVVVTAVLLGVVSALAIDRPFPGRAVARSVLLFGWAVPGVAAALIWSWMFNENSGVLGGIAESLGLGRIPWLTSPDVALWSIVIATVWQAAPFVMLITLAALQSVPGELREAARVDGADALNVFRTATFPHIRPAVALAALLTTVWTLRRFEIIYLLTGGGPLNSTSTIVVTLRRAAFENHDLGVAATFGVIGVVISLAVSIIYFAAERKAEGKSA